MGAGGCFPYWLLQDGYKQLEKQEHVSRLSQIGIYVDLMPSLMFTLACSMYVNGVSM